MVHSNRGGEWQEMEAAAFRNAYISYLKDESWVHDWQIAVESEIVLENVLETYVI